MADWRDDDSFDEDPLDDDMDDSTDSSFDETPFHDPTGPGLLAVVGMWLILGLPMIFLVPMALGDLARGELSGPYRLLAAGVILCAVAVVVVLIGFTRRYVSGRAQD